MPDIPYLTSDQMIEVDRAMIEDYSILLIQMMENAGRNLAHLARTHFLGGNPEDKKVVVLAGTGGNGGGGLVCARRLHNWGAQVDVFTTAPQAAYQGIPAHQFDILSSMQVPMHAAGRIQVETEPALIIDAIIGYSLSGDPKGRAADMIQWANQRQAPVLSLDTPSGIDTATGIMHTPAIQAEATLTLALPKDGLRKAAAREHIGALFLADISVPPALYAGPQLGLNIGPLFSKEEIIRIW